MFIMINNDSTFTPVSYAIDTAEGERRARIALYAAGLDSAPVWAGSPDYPAHRTSARLLASDPDEEVTAVYRPSAELLRAARR